MQLAKFKFVALFVLAASLVGGAGLWAGRSLGPDGVKDSTQAHRTKTTEQQKPAAKQAKPKAASNTPDNWRGQNVVLPQSGTTWQVDWVHDLQEARRLEMDLEKQEAEWADTLSKARRHLLVAQERLRQIEEREKDRARYNRAEEQRIEQRIQAAQARVEAIEDNLNLEAAARTAKTSARTQTRLQEAKERLRRAQMQRAVLRGPNDGMRERTMEERVEARLAVMTAQDALDQIERRQARKRDQIQGDLDLIQERIRRARWGFPPIGAGQDGQLGRKVDQLRQQIEELRRQLRPQTSGTATKP